MEPAAAAVYGIATPTATAVSITVTEHTTGKSYTVVADKLGTNGGLPPHSSHIPLIFSHMSQIPLAFLSDFSQTSLRVLRVLSLFTATHQPVGPEFAGMHSTAGPHFAWKALLKPTAAGGNYTLFAKCTGCTGSGEYSNATITNVTFGDVYHCSGQSNVRNCT
jgi:hypothetical protein